MANRTLPDLFVVIGEDRNGEPIREESQDRVLAEQWAAGINRRGGEVRLERHE